jgi:hypothetical protein
VTCSAMTSRSWPDIAPSVLSMDWPLLPSPARPCSSTSCQNQIQNQFYFRVDVRKNVETTLPSRNQIKSSHVSLKNWPFQPERLTGECIAVHISALRFISISIPELNSCKSPRRERDDAAGSESKKPVLLYSATTCRFHKRSHICTTDDLPISSPNVRHYSINGHTFVLPTTCRFRHRMCDIIP